MRSLVWRCGRRVFDVTARGLIMGVLNVTPDSFSDGGDHCDPDAAVARALAMLREGADIIDIGGESTRPGASPVQPEEELRRVIPVVRRLRAASDAVISVDTSKAVVAEQALAEGAEIINDITALTGDPAMGRVVAAANAGLVIMHMQGRPATMQVAPAYSDVVGEVVEFLRHQLASALSCGMSAEQVVIDPGIGFGKRPEHNAALINALPQLAVADRPVLVGVSRKSFLGWLADAPEVADRHWPGVALTSLARERGARIFRVHDPLHHAQALRMTEAILAHA